MDKYIKKIVNICETVLNDEMGLDALYNEWQEIPEDVTFFNLIYDDLESGIEHYPFTFFGGKPLVEDWKKSDMYYNIFLDYILLNRAEDFDTLVLCRKDVLKKSTNNADEIEEMVNYFFRNYKI